jgi:hypothetical protein
MGRDAGVDTCLTYAEIAACHRGAPHAAMVGEVPCKLTPRHPPSQVVDSIAGQIIYYFIFGVLGACRQAPYKFKKSYGGGFV